MRWQNAESKELRNLQLELRGKQRICSNIATLQHWYTAKYHLPANMKGMGMLCSSCVFLVISLSTLLDQTNSLMCWQNTYSADNPWRIQECDIAAGNETTCLSQYRIHNGVQIPSYFGCHTPNTPCNRLCRVTEGQSNDYSCCCSGDLCNSLPEITPNASDPSGM